MTGLEIVDLSAINRELIEAGYEPFSATDESKYGLRSEVTQPVPQLVRWIADEGQPGILVLSPEQQFIPWSQLKPEIERYLLPQEARVPLGSRVITHELRGHPDFVIRIINTEHVEIGSVWFGSDPCKKWSHDGLVRLGVSWHVSGRKPVVWRVMQRYSDGSYRTIEAL